MVRTKYNSDATSNSIRKKANISQICFDSFEAFHPFINVFDCGITSSDGPFHLITKEDWKLYSRHKGGDRNLTYSDGSKFNPYVDVIRNIFSAEHVQHHHEDNQTTYFTSGKMGLGLLYLDIDAHNEWQKDEYEAKGVLERLFPFEYFRSSRRGQNGYLKVRYTTIEEFNKLALYLQNVLQRLFLHLGILCDIEVKGTITHRGKSGSLAKLPFTNLYPCYQRDDTDHWNYETLAMFKASPIVNSRRIKHIVSQLDIDDDRVQRFAEYKRSLDVKEKAVKKTNPFILLTQNESRAAVQHGACLKNANAVDRKEKTGSSTGDAFLRNRKVLLPFIRDFYKKHKSYPTVEDALAYLHKEGLFSGDWNDRANKRAIRVGQILDFYEPDFDPNKLSNGKHNPIVLRLGQYSWWVRRVFGTGIRASYQDKARFDPVSMKAPIVKAFIPAKFIETFLVVADACLKQDPSDNNGVPTNRFKKLWPMVVDGSPWNQRYYQIVREKFHKLDVIRIIDRNHEKDKAWRWVVGKHFPENNFKATLRKLRKRVPKIARIIIVKKHKVHNTLYKNRDSFQELLVKVPVIRPPPWQKDGFPRRFMIEKKTFGQWLRGGSILSDTKEEND